MPIITMDNIEFYDTIPCKWCGEYPDLVITGIGGYYKCLYSNCKSIYIAHNSGNPTSALINWNNENINYD